MSGKLLLSKEWKYQEESEELFPVIKKTVGATNGGRERLPTKTSLSSSPTYLQRNRRTSINTHTHTEREREKQASQALILIKYTI